MMLIDVPRLPYIYALRIKLVYSDFHAFTPNEDQTTHHEIGPHHALIYSAIRLLLRLERKGMFERGDVSSSPNSTSSSSSSSSSSE